MSANEEQKAPKEGLNLLGSPTFTKLGNGRFKCVETGHEVLEKDKESYSQSKGCRMGLIDYAVSHRKPPLNMFKADPNSRSKLICKLTGDTVNKSEEHIWKHVNGKRFFNKLEKMELEKESNGSAFKKGKEKPKGESKRSMDGMKEEKKKKKDKKQEKKEGKSIDEVIPEVKNDGDDNVDVDGDGDFEELSFWMPPVGERWDFDDGGDRWGSGSESEHEGNDEIENKSVDKNGDEEPEGISARTKRTSDEIGPSGSTSKKKKSKKNPINPSGQLER